MDKLITTISNWIKKEVQKAGKKGTIIGISGGLDSTITAFLCKKALGERDVLGLVMPCHSYALSLADAQRALDFLKIPSQHVDLSPVYDVFMSFLPEGNKLSNANLKARVRMITLYYFANKLDYLVVGTGNKSEYYSGYFTKYGDGGVDIMPLADIYKTELIKLAVYINVPKRIITKPPSADLWEGQTDEAELGITYKELDSTLGNLLEKKQFTDTPKEKFVENLIKQSAHKRTPIPIFKKPS